MQNKLPEHIQQQIEREAEAYAEKTGDRLYNIKEYYTHNDRQAGYQDGATAYAHYKELWEQAKKALEGILLFCELDGKPCDGYRFREEAVNAKALLDSWKEEGNEGE